MLHTNFYIYREVSNYFSLTVSFVSRSVSEFLGTKKGNCHRHSLPNKLLASQKIFYCKFPLTFYKIGTTR